MKKNYCQQLVFQNACRERKKKQTTLNNNDVVILSVSVTVGIHESQRETTTNHDRIKFLKLFLE